MAASRTLKWFVSPVLVLRVNVYVFILYVCQKLDTSHESVKCWCSSRFCPFPFVNFASCFTLKFSLCLVAFCLTSLASSALICFTWFYNETVKRVNFALEPKQKHL